MSRKKKSKDACNTCVHFRRGRNKCLITGRPVDPLKSGTAECGYESNGRMGYKVYTCTLCGRNFTKGRQGGLNKRKRNTLTNVEACPKCVRAEVIRCTLRSK